MKLNVPFYIQEEGKKDCGPIALQMVFSYWGEEYKRDEIAEKVGSETGGSTWTIGLAKAAAEFGFKTEFYSKFIGVNPENFEMEFYKKETSGEDASKIKLSKIIIEYQKHGGNPEERVLDINEIVSKINERCLAIILLNWNVIKGKEGYQGHFVPIVGYDEKKVYIHNAGPNNPCAFMAIEKELFDRARQAKGTDEDIVFIYR